MCLSEIQQIIRQQRLLITMLDHAHNNVEEAVAYRQNLGRSEYYQAVATEENKRADIVEADGLLLSATVSADKHIKMLSDTLFNPDQEKAMGEMARKGREYLQNRIEFLKKEIEEIDIKQPSTGKLIWNLKGTIHELEQILNVLNGGTSVFDKVREEVSC